MCGTEVSKFLKEFLISNELESEKNEHCEKIFLSKQSLEFSKIAERILNRKINVQTE